MKDSVRVDSIGVRTVIVAWGDFRIVSSLKECVNGDARLKEYEKNFAGCPLTTFGKELY